MFMEAMQLYDDGDIGNSLMMYTFLAELGMEVAQSNAAFLHEQGMRVQSFAETHMNTQVNFCVSVYLLFFLTVLCN